MLVFPFVLLVGDLPELRFQALLFVVLGGDGHGVVLLQSLGSNALLALEQVLELLLVFPLVLLCRH